MNKVTYCACCEKEIIWENNLFANGNVGEPFCQECEEGEIND